MTAMKSWDKQMSYFIKYKFAKNDLKQIKPRFMCIKTVLAYLLNAW